MSVDKEVFNDEMNALIVTRGRYLTVKDRDSVKHYWYREFRSCNEEAFKRTMGELKFGGSVDGESTGFPTFKDFRDLYNSLLTQAERLLEKPECGACVNGGVIYRDVISKGIDNQFAEVRDVVAGCIKCQKPSKKNDLNLIDPGQLHKCKLGILRTTAALAMDRVPQEIKWPEFLVESWEAKNPGKEMKKKYFLGLKPEDDPDTTTEIVEPSSNPKVPL